MADLTPPEGFTTEMPPSLRRALESAAQHHVQADGWFAAGLDLIARLQAAMIPTEGLCWYVPRGSLGPWPLIEASRLNDLPVYEVPSGAPLGLGFVLPRCNHQPDCSVHPEPRSWHDEPWARWADRHCPGWRAESEEGPTP